jgi:hypothetical protein
MTEALALLEKMLLSRPCSGVEKTGHLWQFMFGDGDTTLNIECPWRLLLDGKIAFGADDDGQQFGLQVPLDGVKEIEKFLSTSPVILIMIRPGCSDLSLSFQNGVCLEAFNGSSGYEGWACSGEGGVAVAQAAAIWLYGTPAARPKSIAVGYRVPQSGDCAALRYPKRDFR